MSREIKFRVFSEEYGMQYPNDRVGVLVLEHDECWSFGWKDWDDIKGGPTNYEGILMQFSGFKDRNGTDIYEGDIVSDSWKDGNFGVVVFEEGYFNMQLGHMDTNSLQAGECEVVGNIYETPDLIKK